MLFVTNFTQYAFFSMKKFQEEEKVFFFFERREGSLQRIEKPEKEPDSKIYGYTGITVTELKKGIMAYLASNLRHYCNRIEKRNYGILG